MDDDKLTLRDKLLKMAKSAGIAAAAAAAVYFAEWLNGQDFGTWQPLLTAAAAWLVATLNTARK